MLVEGMARLRAVLGAAQGLDRAAEAALIRGMERATTELTGLTAPKTFCEYCRCVVRADRPTCSQCAAPLPPVGDPPKGPKGPIGDPPRPPRIAPDPPTMMTVQR